METVTDEIGSAQAWAQQALADFVAYLPNLIGALGFILLAWLAGRLLRGLVQRLSAWANRGLDRVFRHGAASQARISESAAAIFGQVVFWLVLFVGIAIASRIAGPTAVSFWLDEIVAYLPNLLVGTAIIIIGYVVSVVAGEQVTAAARVARSAQSLLLGRIAQAVVFITALIIGLDQFGVDVTFLVALFAAAAGAVFVGFSVAFGLGARDFVSDIVSARDLVRVLRPGLSVRIGETVGNVLEVTPTRLAIDTPEGRLLIPAREVSASSILIVSPDGGEDGPDE